MDILSSAAFPVLNGLLAQAAKQTEDWWHLNGVPIASCDSWFLVGTTYYLVDIARFYMLGYAYIINNFDAYGSVVQPPIKKKTVGCQNDIIVGRQDWLEIERERLLLPAGNSYIVTI